MNFIIFMPDELRAESVCCYGHPLRHTPHFDSFAAEGTRFSQCHVQHTVCTPSRCSMMTGWYPHVRGHRTLWNLLQPDEPNLFKYLKSVGYDVRCWGKNDLFSEEAFKSSVHEFAKPQIPESCQDRTRMSKKDQVFANDTFLYPAYSGGEASAGDYHAVQEAIRYLQSGPEEHFLLFLPLCLPHPPYAAPEPWHSMFSETDVGELRPPDLEDKPDFYLLIREYRQLGANSESISKTVHARYLGMIAYMDHLFGQLIQALNQSELKEETAVFVCSDHGDWAGDYGLVEKWPTGMDDCLTRIPFLAQIPGGKPGHTVEEPIELFDMMATILELADIEPRHSHFAQSLVPQLRGATGDSKRYVFTEGGYDIHEPHCFEGYESHPAELEGNMYSPKMKQQQEHPESVSRTTCIRSLDHKLIFRHQGVCELYDYKTDPRELINQYDNPNYSEVRARLEKELMNWFQRTSDVTPFERDARGIPHGNFLHQSLPVETFSV